MEVGTLGGGCPLHTRHKIALVLAVTFGALAPVPHSSGVALRGDGMTHAEAAEEYLDTLCQSLQGTHRFRRQVWGGELSTELDEARERLPELRRFSKAYRPHVDLAAVRLFNPPDPWPEDVLENVMAVAGKFARETYLRSRQAESHSAERWRDFNQRAIANRLRLVRASDSVRRQLAIPPPGRAC